MCHFVTLIVPEARESSIADVMERHGRRLHRVDNPAIARLLSVGERQYLTSRGCDCGTSLGMALAEEQRLAEELARQRNRLARLKWSDAKAERWTRDKLAASQRSRRYTDTIDDWDNLLGDLGAAGVREAGLILHSYSGALDVEFDCTADPRVHIGDRKPLLGALEEDVLTRFATGG